jgi:hypothetical protein
MAGLVFGVWWVEHGLWILMGERLRVAGGGWQGESRGTLSSHSVITPGLGYAVMMSRQGVSSGFRILWVCLDLLNDDKCLRNQPCCSTRYLLLFSCLWYS